MVYIDCFVLYLCFFSSHTHTLCEKWLVNSLYVRRTNYRLYLKSQLKIVFLFLIPFARYISYESMKLYYFTIHRECVCVCMIMCWRIIKTDLPYSSKQAMALPDEINTCYFTFGFSPVQANFNYFSRNNVTFCFSSSLYLIPLFFARHRHFFSI